MDNKSELFDLNQEKRELDAFLSKIPGAEPSVSLPLKGAAQTKGALSSLAENKSVFKASRLEPSGSKAEMSDVKNEFIPRFVDTVSFGTFDQTDLAKDKTSSFMSLDEVKKKEPLPRITSAQGVKTLESFKTMTRFDKTSSFVPLDDGKKSEALERITGFQSVKLQESLEATARLDGIIKSDRHVTEMLLSEDKKPSTEVEAEKKIDKASPYDSETEKKIDKAGPYDFAPEKKGVRVGKGIWILIILLILLLAGAGYFWLSSKSYIPGIGSFFKNDQKVASSSVKEINLLNIRQRLVYNVKLGKSIRVIEGVAENSASYPVSKIKVVANLYGADGSLLATMESFGGNILMDAKLENLDAAGLLSDLQKAKTSEDKTPPKGQTPFMIIFTSEAAGVHKLSVLPVDFKKH